MMPGTIALLSHTLPSMTATHELVVPKSMPMTSPAPRAAVALWRRWCVKLAIDVLPLLDVWKTRRASRARRTVVGACAGFVLGYLKARSAAHGALCCNLEACVEMQCIIRGAIAIIGS